MKKWTVFIFVMLIFSFFGSFFSGCTKIPLNERAVNKVMARNSKALAQKYHMRPVGIGVAMPGGDIQYLDLEFQIYGPLSKEGLRKILIDAAHDFLTDINSDSELCFYLKNHSLTIKDIGIVLFLIDSSGRGLNDPNIGIAEILKGELKYLTLVEKDRISSIFTESRESYEEH